MASAAPPTTDPAVDDVHRAIEAVWRIESARVIAGLTRVVRDVGLAEDLAQDALVAALQQWPESGVPDNIVRGQQDPRFRLSRQVEKARESGAGSELFRVGLNQEEESPALELSHPKRTAAVHTRNRPHYR